MSLDHPDATGFRVLTAQRYVLAVCAITLIALVAFGYLALLPAVLAGAAIAAAAAFTLWLTARERLARGETIQPVAAGATADASIEAVVDAMPLAAVMIDREGYITTFNRLAAEVAPSLRRGEPLTFSLRMPAIVDALKRAAATGESQRAEISERVPIDRWYDVAVMPTALIGAAGRTLTLVTFQDLTPLRRVEEMRADFVANASHELRTPLAALSGFIETLQGPARNDTNARDRFLGIMKAQADRMARVIQDLLSLSRIELDAHIRPDGEVELVGAAHQVVDGLQVLARERGVEVAIDAPEVLEVPGDRDEILRVFENLIENALKYGGGGKRVELTLSRVGSEAKVSVRDFGPGIAPEHLPRLTERFYRVDVSHSRAEGGTGLGLSLVKHILNRHRGRLTIDSIVGNGSSFTVYLPVAAGIGARPASS
ncbi:alkaline phosphatase synthesis sensor protein PhoR [Variibacter gotjawalensis]|uniref:histidine kinase n=1 Tax=Variibacter gotjawalensis TaxID=1333996 RepID=A0A0S3PQ71_9BRAD|nr:ATP-binding protein [Variibacter gotjawalensis]NIK48387.1 two-component system phosphate regulon sensor histidine kinase PhoR [Variibacter gotjawalensis]RZS50254.1 two-component system phosphate regulon sensor histidine kinase PhoR [Variibacter gotjawalensis]BAT58087.1 alkaline phosphatase synthesis sensor protein PhoR [Variibacter gotjawalensis]